MAMNVFTTIGPSVMMETKLKVLVEKLEGLHSQVRHYLRPSWGVFAILFLPSELPRTCKNENIVPGTRLQSDRVNVPTVVLHMFQREDGGVTLILD